MCVYECKGQWEDSLGYTAGPCNFRIVYILKQMYPCMYVSVLIYMYVYYICTILDIAINIYISMYIYNNKNMY